MQTNDYQEFIEAKKIKPLICGFDIDPDALNESLKPFLGIGTEVYCAVKMGRKGIGSELKRSYFDLAIKNCADAKRINGDLFADVA